MFDINEFFRLTQGEIVRRPIVCADGFSMSVQASEYHYCSPQSDQGPYSAVEVGFPSPPELDILDWAADPENPTKTVYAYVPVEIINAVIEKHGGAQLPRRAGKEE